MIPLSGPDVLSVTVRNEGTSAVRVIVPCDSNVMATRARINGNDNCNANKCKGAMSLLAKRNDLCGICFKSDIINHSL